MPSNVRVVVYFSFSGFLFSIIADTLQGSISVSLEFDREHAHFRVRDTGVGIPEEGILGYYIFS